MPKFQDSKTTPYVKVTVALAAAQVSRIGALTVHPSNEYQAWQVWCVGTPCGMAAGKFATREAAELFARRLVELADWSASPVDVDEASDWAAKVFVEEKKIALVAAREAAQLVDEEKAPQIWP